MESWYWQREDKYISAAEEPEMGHHLFGIAKQQKWCDVVYGAWQLSSQ